MGMVSGSGERGTSYRCDVCELVPAHPDGDHRDHRHGPLMTKGHQASQNWDGLAVYSHVATAHILHSRLQRQCSA